MGFFLGPRTNATLCSLVIGTINYTIHVFTDKKIGLKMPKR
jgi:hypothetical protein